MKVLNLSDFLRLTDVVKHDIIEKIYYKFFDNPGIINDAVNNLPYDDSYNDFLSQDFNPEMIMKLFKNFEVITNHKSFKFFDEKTTGFNLKCNLYQNMFEIYDTELSIIQLSWMPSTLLEFINNCQNVGIELEWNL